MVIQRLLLIGAVLLPASPLSAQTYRQDIVRRPPPIPITRLGQGHALRTRPPLRPFTYLPAAGTNVFERPFSATTGNPNSWVRAGTDVNRTYGDYFVNPVVWTNNIGLTPAHPNWRDPNNPTNWISVRTVRRFLRQPFSVRPDYSQQPWR